MKQRKQVKMDKGIPTQLRITGLIFALLGKFIRHGNLPVHYHIIGHEPSHNNPMEVEGVEIRTGCCGEDDKRLTIW